MKSVKYYLTKLPKFERKLALLNFKYHKTTFSNTKTDCMSKALINAFYWDKTPEGSDYWRRLYEMYKSYDDLFDSLNRKNQIS